MHALVPMSVWERRDGDSSTSRQRLERSRSVVNLKVRAERSRMRLGSAGEPVDRDLLAVTVKSEPGADGLP